MGGTKCSVPGCRSNYNSAEGHISVFKFPSDKELKEDWVRRIHRKDFVPTKYSVVCIKHFQSNFIIRTIEAEGKDGNKISCQRKRPILSNDAYPTIFSGQPAYLSSTETFRDAPTDRAAIQMEIEKKKDSISSLDEAMLKLGKGLLDKNWYFNINSSRTVINIFKCNFDSEPKINSCVNINYDYSVEIWKNNNKLDNSKYSFILGKENKCDTWSKFNLLFDHVSSLTDTGSSVEDKISYALKLLDECCNESPYDSKQFKFLVQQISLHQSNHPHYSPETLLWSCLFFTQVLMLINLFEIHTL